jgi:CRP/FNR family cyclic AMP-dependent transcriptional regulator
MVTTVTAPTGPHRTGRRSGLARTDLDWCGREPRARHRSRGPRVLDQLAEDGLRSGFLFTLPRAAAERLLADGIRISVPAGAMIYHEEESPRVIVVVTGLLRVFLRSVDGRQVTVRYVRSGDVAGLPLVVGGPAPMSIQAMTGSSVVAFRVETLRSMLASEPRVAQACAEELTRQLYRAFDEISEQAFLSVRQRVARHLLDLVSAEEGPPLVVRLSQQDLADQVGSVREVVTRTLHQLRADGLIETARDEVVLLDPVRLSEEASIPEGRAGDQSATEATTPPPSPSHARRGASRHRRSRS